MTPQTPATEATSRSSEQPIGPPRRGAAHEYLMERMSGQSWIITMKIPAMLADQQQAVPPGQHVRDLGARERFMHLCSFEHPTHFCIAAEIAGEMAPEDFPPAFAAVQRRHPFLNVEIREPSDARRGATLHRIDRPIDMKIRLSSRDSDWKREVERELTTRQPGSTGPLMRASILHRPSGVHVVLTCSHVISDALSAVFIIRDLMAALNGHAILPLPISPSMDSLLAAPPASAEDGKPLLRPDPELLRAVAASDLWRDFDGDRVTVSTLAIGTALVVQIGERARANGTTVHGAMCAALALSLFDERSLEACTIANPINTRGVLGVEEACGLFSVIGTVRLPRNDRGAFWTLARQTTEELAQQRSVAGISAYLRLMATCLDAEEPRKIASGLLGSLNQDSILSNLGRLSIPETVGRLRLAAFWGPMLQTHRKRERFIGVATVANRLHLVQTSPRNVASILGAMKDWLNDAANDRV